MHEYEHKVEDNVGPSQLNASQFINSVVAGK